MNSYGKEKLTLFLDEIQRVNGAGEKLKIIYDNVDNIKIFATGSSSLQIRSDVLNYLVGRALVFELYTLSFSEFLKAKDKQAYNVFLERKNAVKMLIQGRKPEIKKPLFEEKLLKLWKEYAIYGGYPEVVKEKDKNMKQILLKNIINTHMEKDVISFFKILETDNFSNFSKALSFNTANQFSLSSISREMRISYPKAAEYTNILTNTYIVSLLNPYYKNLVTEIKKEPKLYFLDLGLGMV